MADEGKQTRSMNTQLQQTLTPVNNKRSEPFSPDNISPSMLQAHKQAKLIDLPTYDIGDPLSHSASTSAPTVSAVQEEAVVKISDIVCKTLNNSEFIDQLIPVISQKVLESIKPTLKQIINETLQPHLDDIKTSKDLIKKQESVIKKQEVEILALKNKYDRIEARLEEQEQYSRRTSLRFNNVKVATNPDGSIKQPVDTDKIIKDICKTKLGVTLDTNDIGRSHPIGRSYDGKISVIVRFLSYRQRRLVFANKKKLKGDPDKLNICENLTKFRYDLVKRLSAHRQANRIHSYWTHDGSIIVKATSQSPTVVIKNVYDINTLINGDDDSSSSESETED